MEKSGFKRFLAFFLVVALMVGYMPASVFAEDSSTDADSSTTSDTKSLKLIVEREEVQKEVETGETPGSSEDGSEDPTEEDSETPSDGADTPAAQAEEPQYELDYYLYTAKLMLEGSEVTKGVTYAWSAGEEEGTESIFQTTAASADVTVEYDGIGLSATVDSDSAAVEANGKVEGYSAVKGVKLSEPKVTSAAVVSSDKWVCAWQTDNLDAVDGGYVAPAVGECHVATMNLTGDSGDVYAAVEVKPIVAAPSCEAAFYVGDDALAESYYADDVTVKVKVTSKDAVISTDYLGLEVLLGEEVQNVSWSDDLVAEVKVTETSEISVKSNGSDVESAKVSIDRVPPAFEGDIYAYNTEDATYVSAKITTGMSGLDMLKVNGNDSELVAENLYKTSLVDSSEITLKAVSGAGIETEAPDPVAVQAALEVIFEEPELAAGEGGEVDGITYIQEGQKVIIKVKNADEDLYKLDEENTIVAENAVMLVTDEEGNEIEVTWEYADGVWSTEVAIEDSLNGLVVKAVDAKDRSVVETMETVYVVDTTAPSINFEVKDPSNSVETEQGTTDYYGEAIDFVISVTDDNLEAVEVSYELNGVMTEKTLDDFADNKLMIRLDHNDTLANVNVSAVDNTSNPATDSFSNTIVVDAKDPVIKATVSGNVTRLYQNKNGSFAVVGESSEPVVVTVQITDDNLDPTTAEYMVKEGWTEANGVWTKSLEVPADETGSVNISFMAKDLAGRTSSDDVILCLAEDSTADAQLANGLVLEASEEKIYSVELQLDRRGPGSGAVDAAPEVILKVNEGVNTYDKVEGEGESARKITIYDQAPTFTLDISDKSVQEKDSGIAAVKWTLTDSNGFVTGSGEKTYEDPQINDSIEVPVELTAEFGETDAAVLTIEVCDDSGNKTPYTKYFGVDTKEPEIVVEVTSDDTTPIDYNNCTYYNTESGISIAVNVSDMLLVSDKVKVSVNEEEQKVTINDDGVATCNILQNAEGEYELKVEAEDAFRTVEPVTETYVIDCAGPEVTISRETKGNHNGDNFNQPLMYTVTVSDYYLSNETEGEQIVTLKYELSGEPVEVSLDKQNWNYSDEDGKDTYTYTIELKNRQELNGLTIQAVDNAGNPMTMVGGNAFRGENEADENGVWFYGKMISVESDPPVVTVVKNEGVPSTNNGVDYYSSQVVYDVTVEEDHLNSAVLTYTIEKVENGQIVLVTEQVTTAEDENLNWNYADGVYSARVEVNEGEMLTDMSIMAVDTHTNSIVEVNGVSFSDEDGDKTFNYAGNDVAVDSTAPVVEISQNSTGYTQTIGMQEFYKENVEYTVKVTDRFLSNAAGYNQMAVFTYTINDNTETVSLPASEGEDSGWNYSKDNGLDTYTFTFTVINDQTLTDMTVSVTDNSGWTMTGVEGFSDVDEDGVWTYDGNDVIVDTDPAAVTVTQVLTEGDEAATNGSVDYYSDTVTYKVTVSDDYLWYVESSNVQKANLVYTITGSNDVPVVTTVVLPGTKDAGTVWEKDEKSDTYTHSIEVFEGEILTDIAIEVVDNAGVEISSVLFGDEEQNAVNGTWTYNGNDVAVDNSAPAVSITKTGEVKNTLGETEYHDGTVSYTVKVEDSILSNAAVEGQNQNVKFTYTVNDETIIVSLSESENNWTYENVEGVDTYTYTFDLKDGDILTDMSISATDNSGLSMTGVSAELTGDPDAEAVIEEAVNGTWTYGGKDIVMDTTAPEAEVEFSDNVESFYYNSINNTIYVILKDTVNGNSGEEQTGDQEVTMTIKVTDNNLTLADNVYSIKSANDFAWSGDTAVNKESTVVYTATSDKVSADGVATFVVDVTVFDLAGNKLGDFAATPVADENAALVIQPDNGVINYNVTVDRQRSTSDLESNVPTIVVTPGIEPTKNVNEDDLFNGNFEFELTVTDYCMAGDEYHVGESGLKYISWSVADKNGVVLNQSKTINYAKPGSDPAEGEEDAAYAATIKIPVVQKSDDGESNNVTLYITVEDQAGNQISYSKTFGFDTLAPRVRLAQSNDDVSNGNFFHNDQKITVEVEDLNFTANEDYTNTVSEVKNSGWTSVVGNTYRTELVYNVDGYYTFAMATKDLANNNAVIDYETDMVALKDFVIDKTAPTVDVNVTSEGGSRADDAGQVNYYEKPVQITVKISDKDLWNNPGEDDVQIATLTYTLEDGTSKTIELSAPEAEEDDNWMYSQSDDEKAESYTYSFTLYDGQVLTGLSIEARDNANNPAVYGDENKADSFSINEDAAEVVKGFKCEDGLLTYNGYRIAVDNTAPAVTVTKTDGKYVQTYENIDYYDGLISYTVDISDRFLNENVGIATLVVNYWDEVEGETVETINLFEHGITAEATDALEADVDAYSYTFELTEAKTLTGMSLEIMDNAGYTCETIVVVDTENMTSFEKDENVPNLFNYTGNDVVCDETAPTAVVTFSENVTSFYYNVNNNTIYAILDTPVIGESGQVITDAGKTVTMTIEVTDLNLTLDESNINGMQANDPFAWSGETPVNAATSVTYRAYSATVNADGVAAFEVDVTVGDLAGNKLAAFTAIPAADKNAALKIEPVDGRIVYNVSVDRLRSGSKDQTPPIVEVIPSINPTTTADGLDLFNGNFHFNLHVADGDGQESIYNSGIKTVIWSVTDKNGVVQKNERTVNHNEGPVYAEDFDINVNGGTGESNDVLLEITVEDYVGNQITYSKTFGFDTLAPRVSFNQSNQSAMNGFYFKDNQVITVYIEDLNFEATTSSVTTQVGFNGWTKMANRANTYTTSLTYNTDGDYTFEMATTDRANNDAVIDYETGMVALQSFTIDKTAPVIDVSYSPAIYVDKNGSVEFFNQDRTVTAKITEHNFKAVEVVSELGNANHKTSLSSWRDSGDVHTATYTFSEGNEYIVKVSYTDLAGNEATAYTSPVFSVDKTDPTITMSSGEVQNGQPIGGDLILGYTINDAQSNLKNFNVELTFVGADFTQKTVSGDAYYVQSESDGTNGYITFTNIEALKSNDGIYTLHITATDYAGHTVYSDLIFSLNRGGSTFSTGSSATADFLTANESGSLFHNVLNNDLVIVETNPNQVWQDSSHTEEGSIITISVNGESMILTRGEDYELEIQELGNAGQKWYQYTYTIYSSVFMNSENGLVNGDYSIYFYSEDDAENKNTNESTENTALTKNPEGNYSGKISFTLDDQDPVVNVVGLEKQSYRQDNVTVRINTIDNSPATIEVYIDDVLVEIVQTGDGAISSDWIYYDAELGDYVLNVSAKDDPQNIVIVVTDAAGNSVTRTFERITINSSLWIQFVNSTPAKVTAGVALAALIFLIILLLKKRKKNEVTEENSEAMNP